MNKIWKILPLLFLSVLFIGCENKSEGSAASDVTNNGDDASDLVENEMWNKTIDIVWNGTDVTVTGSADGVKVSHSNGYVTINSNAENVEYMVSGVGTGQLSIYGNYKYKLLLDGLTLACPDGPAINSQCPRTCYAVLQGTNILSDVPPMPNQRKTGKPPSSAKGGFVSPIPVRWKLPAIASMPSPAIITFACAPE